MVYQRIKKELKENTQKLYGEFTKKSTKKIANFFFNIQVLNMLVDKLTLFIGE